MDHPEAPAPTVRHDGWTPERRTLFLDHLSHKGNVRAACARVGLSPEAAYCLRRRDALFARAWAAALALAREHSVQILADRALEGIEERVYYRGQLIDTRRKYDNRLLLAHLARLDKLVDEDACAADVARFDELLAVVAGVELPEALAREDDVLPPARDAFAEEAAREAYEREFAAREEAAAAKSEDEDEDEESVADNAVWETLDTECSAQADRARAAAERQWDTWRARACDAVDALRAAAAAPPAPGSSPRTASMSSSSSLVPALASPLAGGPVARA